MVATIHAGGVGYFTDGSEGGSEEEFDLGAEGDEPDDESTLIEEERLAALQGDTGGREEVALLKGESEIPIEQLRALYAGMDDMSDDTHSEEEDNDDEEEEDDEEDNEGMEVASDGGEGSGKDTVSAASAVVSFSRKRRMDDDEEDGNDASLDVDGAMRRLEAADQKARSVFVSTDCTLLSPFYVLQLPITVLCIMRRV
jgi:hypothetical protein